MQFELTVKLDNVKKLNALVLLADFVERATDEQLEQIADMIGGADTPEAAPEKAPAKKSPAKTTSKSKPEPEPKPKSKSEPAEAKGESNTGGEAGVEVTYELLHDLLLKHKNTSAAKIRAFLNGNGAERFGELDESKYQAFYEFFGTLPEPKSK